MCRIQPGTCRGYFILDHLVGASNCGCSNTIVCATCRVVGIDNDIMIFLPTSKFSRRRPARIFDTAQSRRRCVREREIKKVHSQDRAEERDFVPEHALSGRACGDRVQAQFLPSISGRSRLCRVAGLVFRVYHPLLGEAWPTNQALGRSNSRARSAR
jgi:hypothetical protein